MTGVLAVLIRTYKLVTVNLSRMLFRAQRGTKGVCTCLVGVLKSMYVFSLDNSAHPRVVRALGASSLQLSIQSSPATPIVSLGYMVAQGCLSLG